MESVFELIFLLGRPASGKSEFLDYMQKQPPERARERYGLGRLTVLDDFPLLWEKFEEDDILERLGRRRIWSEVEPHQSNYNTTDPLIWPFLIEKLNVAALRALEAPTFTPGEETVLIEFSRGGPNGYCDALQRFGPRILARAAILYIEVSFDESCRRNRARYDEARKSSILAHSVPEEAMKGVYAGNDWPALTKGDPGCVTVTPLRAPAAHIRVPYVTMCNEPESTDPAVLDVRYHEALRTLMDRWRGL